MKKRRKKSVWDKIEEAKKDPEFMKEVDEFIKVTTNVYKLSKPRNRSKKKRKK